MNTTFDIHEATKDSTEIYHALLSQGMSNATLWGDLYENFIETLQCIETFIKDVLTSTQLPYERSVRYNKLNPSQPRYRIDPTDSLAIYGKRINDWLTQYRDEYEYSAYVQLFFDCCFALQIQQTWLGHVQNHSAAGKPAYELYNDLVVMIRQRAQEDSFKKKIINKQHSTDRNYRSAVEYVKCLFNNHSRLMVLRIDLGYGESHTKQISPEMARMDFAHFLNNFRKNNSLSQYLKGYLWKLEFGEHKGCHFHLLLFYDGSKVQQDVSWGKRLGEYWIQVVGNKGYYWNCNANKTQYKHLGIGMIHRNEVATCMNMLNRVLKYMFKSEQYLLAKSLNSLKRTFGKGLCVCRTNRLCHYQKNEALAA